MEGLVRRVWLAQSFISLAESGLHSEGSRGPSQICVLE